MNENLVQVEISILGTPATTPAQAMCAILDATGTEHEIEAVDAEHGIWLVGLPAHLVTRLEVDGYLEVIGDVSTLRAEMP